MDGNLIKDIFESMQYGEGVENVDNALEWLKNRDNTISLPGEHQSIYEVYNITMKHVNNSNKEPLCTYHVHDNDFISNLLDTINKSNNKWIDTKSLQRAELLFKLGTEIQKQERLFCELELATRGILCKDTKHLSLPLLTEYIQFYSSFPVNYERENPTWKPPGLCVGVFPETTPLSTLGMFLGPSLAAGYNVILYTEHCSSVIATLIQDIAIKIGIPDNTITIIPSKFIDLNVFLTNENVAVLTIFDHLYKKNYNLSNISNKKILNLSSTGAPMIVFDGADLDSACQCVIEAVWGYRGMTPWSTKNLLIQESIFDDFVNRLKQKIDEIRVSFDNDSNADISHTTDLHDTTFDKLKNIIEKAKNHGSEIYPDDKRLIPTLLIGGNIFNNNVIDDNILDIPIVNLRRFRTFNEAALLANNTRQRLAVSVWTENISLANEIVQKLDTTIIWINGYGKFYGNLPLSPIKNNGGYFGGRQGFYEYVINKDLKLKRKCVKLNNGKLMEEALKAAMKAQITWSKQTRFQRTKKLQILTQILNSNRETFDNEWMNDWLVKIHQYIVKDFNEAHIIDSSYQIIMQRKPCGVIVIETPEKLNLHNKTVIIAALIEGNSVVLLNESQFGRGFYEFLQKHLPIGLLQIVDLSQESIKIAALYKELNVYLGERFVEITSMLPLKDCLKFKAIPTDLDEIRDRVTVVKNVWSTVGQSFL